MNNRRSSATGVEEGRAAVIDAIHELENLTVRERIDLAELQLRSEIARRIIRQFLKVNGYVLAFIAVLFLIDEFNLYTKTVDASSRIITANVIMAVIGATTVQFGAIAFAVSQWLFPKHEN